MVVGQRKARSGDIVFAYIWIVDISVIFNDILSTTLCRTHNVNGSY